MARQARLALWLLRDARDGALGVVVANDQRAHQGHGHGGQCGSAARRVVNEGLWGEAVGHAERGEQHQPAPDVVDSIAEPSPQHLFPGTKAVGQRQVEVNDQRRRQEENADAGPDVPFSGDLGQHDDEKREGEEAFEQKGDKAGWSGDDTEGPQGDEERAHREERPLEGCRVAIFLLPHLPELMTHHTDRQRRREGVEEEAQVRERRVPAGDCGVAPRSEGRDQQTVDGHLQDRHHQQDQEQVGRRMGTPLAHLQEKASEANYIGQGWSRWGRSGKLAAAGLFLVCMGVSATFAAAPGSQKGAAPAVIEQAPTGPLILLDPGHGGTNAGAPSVREGLFEKHLTLAMAGALREKLEARGFRVELTRHEDTYLSLRERGQMANAMNADLFISLHANATENHSHSGYETFILTPEAVDIDSRVLRHESARTRDGLDTEVSLLLDDVERIFLIAQESERDRVDLALVALHQNSKGPRIALLGQFDEGFVLELGKFAHRFATSSSASVGAGRGALWPSPLSIRAMLADGAPRSN